jgi:cytochrome c-type biogenesis protein CcmH/NrfG
VRRRLPLVAWGAFWFFCTLAPAAIIAGMLWPGFGRYLYLPSVGLAVALGSAAVHAACAFPRWRTGLAVASALYLAVLALYLRGWVKDFRNQETLYTAAIEKNPEGAHGYGWLAMAYLADGRDEDAIGPLVVAHRLAPDEVRYAKELLKAFVRTERADAAIRLAEECAPRYERDATAFHMTLLNAKHMTDPDAASFQVLECLRKQPSSADCAAALEKLVTVHPKRSEYRAIVREKLQDERLAVVRRQTEPLMRSLR